MTLMQLDDALKRAIERLTREADERQDALMKIAKLAGIDALATLRIEILKGEEDKRHV